MFLARRAWPAARPCVAAMSTASSALNSVSKGSKKRPDEGRLAVSPFDWTAWPRAVLVYKQYFDYLHPHCLVAVLDWSSFSFKPYVSVLYNPHAAQVALLGGVRNEVSGRRVSAATFDSVALRAVWFQEAFVFILV